MKTATELGIWQGHLDALHRVLKMLESGEMKQHAMFDPQDETIPQYGFNMGDWFDQTDENIVGYCGSVGCIGGWAEHFAMAGFGDFRNLPENLERLFYCKDTDGQFVTDLDNITVPQAAAALRNYLTTGEAKWREVLFAKT